MNSGPGELMEATVAFVPKILIWIVLWVIAACAAHATDAQVTDAHVRTDRLPLCASVEKAQQFASKTDNLAAAIASDDVGAAQPCLVANIAYISGRPIERLRSHDAGYELTEILIVGVATPFGYLSVTPSLVYTLVKVDEEAA